MLQRLALEILHHDVGFAVIVADFVDGADIRVIQRGCGFSLALEAAEGLRIFGYIVGEEFQGYEAIELDVLGLEDYAHPATTEFLQHAVVRNGAPRKRRRIRHRSANIRSRPESSQRGGLVVALASRRLLRAQKSTKAVIVGGSIRRSDVAELILRSAHDGCLCGLANRKSRRDASATRSAAHLEVHFRFADSALACFRMGMSGSASFHSVKKSL